MKDYYSTVDEEAKDFLDGLESDLKEAIREGKDFDRNDIDRLDSSFHEAITDREHIAGLVREGYQEGEIVEDEPEEDEGATR